MLETGGFVVELFGAFVPFVAFVARVPALSAKRMGVASTRVYMVRLGVLRARGRCRFLTALRLYGGVVESGGDGEVLPWFM